VGIGNANAGRNWQVPTLIVYTPGVLWHVLGMEHDDHLQLLDAKGNLVLSFNGNRTPYALPALPAAMYFWEIKAKDGASVRGKLTVIE
jgi:hypothetical protein